MTIDLLPQQPLPMPSHPRRRDGKSPLPAPEVRAGLRRSWNLSEQQVATAFGVTPATVRSWEAGRTTPTGRRRAAYAAFLSGLAQGLAPVVVTDPATASPRTPAIAPSPPPAKALTPSPRGASTPSRTRPTAPPPPTAIPRVASPTREPAPRTVGLPVAGAPDPVSAARRRGLRRAAAAAGLWLVFVHLMVTTGPQRAAGATGGDHGRAAATERAACSCPGPDRL
ncbi:helix-turn-helix domain-containing protein [Streptomyces sp. NPDC005302]|uniref:helix-turn-helix domain-containing protein n=1 Tax=Streptomyces sp. NPDC005302 TaxID=3154675 RepID=UPI0033AE90A6